MHGFLNGLEDDWPASALSTAKLDSLWVQTYILLTCKRPDYGESAGEPAMQLNHGKMQRDFANIDSTLERLVRTLDRAPKPDSLFQTDQPHPVPSLAPYQVLNMGTHGPARLPEYVDAFEDVPAKRSERSYSPMRSGNLLATFADVTLLTSWTGYEPGTPGQTWIRRCVTLQFEDSHSSSDWMRESAASV